MSKTYRNNSIKYFDYDDEMPNKTFQKSVQNNNLNKKKNIKDIKNNHYDDELED